MTSEVLNVLNNRSIPFLVSGKDYKISCLNPEHDDSDPSLRVDKITGAMHCFSCGFKGNIFNHFEEQPNWLEIRRHGFSKLVESKMQKSESLYIPSNAILHDDDWRGISGETLREFGAFRHTNPEFAGRLVFPLYNLSGKLVSFIGRSLSPDVEPKYKFHPGGVALPLYPVKNPIKSRFIVVEGLLDAINLHDKGLTNAVSSFGASGMTLDKLRVLKMRGATGIDIIYDADDAGQEAAEKLKLLCEKAELGCRNIKLSHVNDPGELTRGSVEKLRKSLYGENSLN